MKLSQKQATNYDHMMLDALRQCIMWHEKSPSATSLWLLRMAQQKYRAAINPYLTDQHE